MNHITVALERLSQALMQQGKTDCKSTSYTAQTRFTHMSVGHLHLTLMVKQIKSREHLYVIDVFF